MIEVVFYYHPREQSWLRRGNVVVSWVGKRGRSIYRRIKTLIGKSEKKVYGSFMKVWYYLQFWFTLVFIKKVICSFFRQNYLQWRTSNNLTEPVSMNSARESEWEREREVLKWAQERWERERVWEKEREKGTKYVAICDQKNEWQLLYLYHLSVLCKSRNSTLYPHTASTTIVDCNGFSHHPSFQQSRLHKKPVKVNIPLLLQA